MPKRKQYKRINAFIGEVIAYNDGTFRIKCENNRTVFIADMDEYKFRCLLAKMSRASRSAKSRLRKKIDSYESAENAC